jgi:hypothetical protein
VLASNVSNKSGCDIPCRGAPHTGQVSAFKVISVPQHAQKAATLFNLHNSCNSLDECRKCKDAAFEIDDRFGEAYLSFPIYLNDERIRILRSPLGEGNWLRYNVVLILLRIHQSLYRLNVDEGKSLRAKVGTSRSLTL